MDRGWVRGFVRRLVKIALFGIVLAGCATNDAVLEQQIEELRRQMAEMRAKQDETPRQTPSPLAHAPDDDPFGLGKSQPSAVSSAAKPLLGAAQPDLESGDVPRLYPAPTRPPSPQDAPTFAASAVGENPIPITSTAAGTTPAGLPVVRLSPPVGNQRGSLASPPDAPPPGPARVAKALSGGASKKTKSSKVDIALPHHEPLTFQTIDSEGNVFGRRPDNHGSDSAEEEHWGTDSDEPDREVRVTGVEPVHPIHQPTVIQPAVNPSRARLEDGAASATPQPTQELNPPQSNAASVAGPPTVMPSTAATLYGDGISLLKERRHGDAIARFDQLLADYPEHGLADNALYWKAEAFYDQQQFDTALPVFQEVITRFPLGNKVPDAMVKVGLCLQNLGQPDQARRVLREVLELYPKSDAAQVAQERLPAI